MNLSWAVWLRIPPFQILPRAALIARMESRLAVRKTYKLYIGGKFVRSESGRHLLARGNSGDALDNYCRASRKDFRMRSTRRRGRDGRSTRMRRRCAERG